MEFTDSGDILALGLEEKPITGRVLLIQPDTGKVGELLTQKGIAWSEWSWLWSERQSATWPSEELVNCVILRLPTVRELTTLVLEVSASRLAPGGTLLIYGANHEGVKSIHDHLAPWFERSEVVIYKHRERVVSAVRAAVKEGLRTRLEDWQRIMEASIQGKATKFISYPGMFAHGTLDQGTKLLLANLPECPAGAKILDMGCGTGVLARAIQDRTPDVSIDAVDLNAFAIEATNKNVPGVHALWGDSWRALAANAKYQFIISNPPVHQGARQTTQPLEYFISHAKEHLVGGGTISLVVQGTIPVKRYFDKAGLRSTLMAEDTIYQVWQAHS